MVPFLTGKRLYHNELHNENYGPYDDWPLIWKNYSLKGYVTALVEDYPKFTLFNYESKGFVQGSPTDFYPRPFWMHLFKDYNPLMLKYMPFSLSHCYKERVAKVDIFLDQAHHFIRQCSKQRLPFFAFFFYIEMTHNDFNQAQTIDWHLSKFFQRSSSYLKDAIVILMGDHGNRFGPILQTTIGRIEERMPLFALHLPQSLIDHHPSLSKNLHINQNRLITWLDIHQMLSDVLHKNFTKLVGTMKEQSSDHHRPAYSPWREEIPFTRNCPSALIPDLYCSCISRVPIGSNSNLAESASKALVDYINALLHPFSLCATLFWNQTLSAELIMPSDSTVQYRGYRQRIELMILVQPSKALFRSRLYRSAIHSQWTVDDGQITRINQYGNQSSCITERHLKPFCYCILTR